MTTNKIPFFFIIGRPRSGTTLLRTLLDAHPNCNVPPEYPVITDIFHRFGAKSLWNASKSALFYNAFRKPQLFDFWKYEYLNIQEQSLKNDLDSIPDNTPIIEILKLFYLHSASAFPKEEIRLLGDKNPVYALYTSMLMRWFPEAKFVFITRDYRDNFVSMRKFEFEAPNIAIQAYRWKYISRMMLRLEKNYPGRIYRIRHEDLASEPEATLQPLLQFLGLPWDNSILQFHEKAEKVAGQTGKDVFMKYHSSLMNPVNSDNVGLWRKVLTQKEIRIADYITRKIAPRMGYEPQGISIKTTDLISVWFFSAYAFLLYQLMLAGEKLPYALKVRLAGMLPSLVMIYRSITSKKQPPTPSA